MDNFDVVAACGRQAEILLVDADLAARSGDGVAALLYRQEVGRLSTIALNLASLGVGEGLRPSRPRYLQAVESVRGPLVSVLRLVGRGASRFLGNREPSSPSTPHHASDLETRSCSSERRS